MKTRRNSASRILILILIILVLLNLALLIKNARLGLEASSITIPFLKSEKTQSIPLVETLTPTLSPPSQTPSKTVPLITMIDPSSASDKLIAQGVMLLSIRDGNFVHLFAYHPLYLPLTRLTNQPWDSTFLSVSPNGSRLAYTSRQNGYWDLYILDLVSGKEVQLTDTPEYEGSPTWSPDEQWIAYERYGDDNLDIYLQSLTDPSADPIQLTDDPGIDSSPAWSPQGREIAFVSTRSGNEEIWLAQLDRVDDRFTNLSNRAQTRDRYPAWSADGSKLAWAVERDGNRQIVFWRPDHPDQPARLIGEGDRAIWSPDGTDLFSEINDPQATGLTAYEESTGRLSLPLTYLPGSIYGMAWVKGPLAGWLAEKIQNPLNATAEPLWQPVLTRTVGPAGRMGLVPLDNVIAPQALLHDSVDEAFVSLRKQISVETGWDSLYNLENAYVPLTTPLTPSIQNDWLYTGRSFAVNPLLMSAGWVVISKDEFSGQVYWRVYLKARYQDGSMGSPLTSMVWDLNARYMGDPQAYEQGGKPGQVPSGYWIDMTEIAKRYGWERLPSWINWKTFYPSIHYNQFVMTGGLDWNQAMAELYPAEALRTSTSIPTQTSTATSTTIPTKTSTATKTPTTPPASATPVPIASSTITPTLQPTMTPDTQ